MPMTSLAAGDLNLFDLRRDLRFRAVNPFHSVHFHLPRVLRNRVASESGMKAGSRSNPPAASACQLSSSTLPTPSNSPWA